MAILLLAYIMKTEYNTSVTVKTVQLLKFKKGRR